MFSNIVTLAVGPEAAALHLGRRIAPTRPHMACLAVATAAVDRECLSLSQVQHTTHYPSFSSFLLLLFFLFLLFFFFFFLFFF